MAGESRRDFHEHRPWTMPTEGARRAAFERFSGPSRWPSWMLDAVRAREQPGTPEAIDALAEISLADQDGRRVRFRDLWRDGPAIIVWLRQFGCPFCRAYAVELNRARARFSEAGARLVLIGQGTSVDARRFRIRLGVELQILTDADRVTYLWAGTKLAALDELIGPLVIGRALVRMARQRVVPGRNTTDQAQLGGSIVVTPDGRVPFAHISRDASDVAPPADLLAAVGAIRPGRAGKTRESTTRPKAWCSGSQSTAATAVKEEVHLGFAVASRASGSDRRFTKMRRRVWVGLAAAAGALLIAGTALATGLITVKGIGAFGVGDEVGYGAGHTYTAEIAPGSIVNTVLLRVPPGAAFPWHYHTATLTVTVASGRFTLQDAGTCDRQTFSAGEGFVEEAGVIHRATNTGSDLAVLYVTYLGVPAGQPGNVFEPPSFDPC